MSNQDWPGSEGGPPQWGPPPQPPPGYGPPQPPPGYGAPPPGYGPPQPPYPGGPGYPPGGGKPGGNKGLLIGLATGGGALVIIAVIVLVVVLIQTNRTSPAPRASAGVGTAKITKLSNGTVVMAKPGVTSPVLDIWEDFQCPICKEFERTNGASVKQLVAGGKVKIVYHPMTIFASGAAHDNSLRALNASLAAPAANWVAFHDKLYAAQPPESQTGGFSTGTLLKLGEQAGITDSSFAPAVRGLTLRAQAESATQRALSSDGIQGTPTLKLNDKELGIQTIMSDKSALPEAVKNAH